MTVGKLLPYVKPIQVQDFTPSMCWGNAVLTVVLGWGKFHPGYLVGRPSSAHVVASRTTRPGVRFSPGTGGGVSSPEKAKKM